MISDPEKPTSPLHVPVATTEVSAATAPTKSLDEVLESMPVGWFHYRLLVICGLSFMADGLEVSLLSFISTCAGKDWDLSDSEVALITSIVFAGQLFGTFFWGPVADKYGRRIAFIVGCFIITIGGFLSGASPSYPYLLLFRGLVGFGVGGVTVPFDLLAEFSPSSHRGRFLIFIEYFWTIGSMFVAAMAWIFLTSSGWRILTYVTAIPVALSSVASIWYLPESPRWLLVQGRVKEAEEVVRAASVVNGTSLEAFNLAPSVHAEESANIMEFFEPKQRRTALPLWFIWLCFGFTYYGVVLFVSRIFEHHESDDDDDTCSFAYSDIFISAASEVAGCTLTALVIDKWGRVTTQSATYFLAGLGVFFMGVKMPHAALTFMSIVARMGSLSGSSATWVATPELFSTQLRATGHSIANSMARIGAFFTPFLVDNKALSNLEVGLALAIVNIAAVLAAFFLPETAGNVLDEEIVVPTTHDIVERMHSSSKSIDHTPHHSASAPNLQTSSLTKSLLDETKTEGVECSPMNRTMSS